MEEIWKDIPGYEGYYQVSNYGGVRSVDRLIFINGNITNVKGKLLRSCNSGGYKIVMLNKHSRKMKKVHRLVLSAFEGVSDLDCNHKDGVKSNNYIDNLEYCTPSENALHAHKIGLIKTAKGVRIFKSKLTDEIIANIRLNRYNLTNKEFSILYSIHDSNISRIINRKTWSHI